MDLGINPKSSEFQNQKNILPINEVDASNQIIPGKYIVVFKENINLRGRSIEMRNKALSKMRGQGVAEANLGFVYSHTIQGFSVSMGPTEAARLANDPDVAYVEQDQIVSISQKKPGSGGGTTGQRVPWGITAVKGISNYTGTGVAWVIDSGIDLDHPDLNVDVARSRDFTGSVVGADDENGHGSHVAGTIAAKNNTIGVIGVAPNAKVVAVKVLNRRGSGQWSGVIAGVDYVGQNGVVGDVANMSLGGGLVQSLNDAVVKASSKVKFALAAGNESTDAATRSPASANGTNIFTVSAHDSGKKWASFSNFGNPPIDYCAPGVSILSTWKGGAYNTISGTSMATPHVAGILLVGSIQNGGQVSGDPDGSPDILASN